RHAPHSGRSRKGIQQFGSAWGLCLLRVLRWGIDGWSVRRGLPGHCCWSDWRSRQLLSTGHTETCSRTVMDGRGISTEGSCGEFVAGSVGSDHQALATGAVNRLDHKLLEPVQDLFTGFLLLEPERVHVGDHGLLVQVVADQVRYVRIDELVIRHTIAHGVGNR